MAYITFVNERVFKGTDKSNGIYDVLISDDPRPGRRPWRARDAQGKDIQDANGDFVFEVPRGSHFVTNLRLTCFEEAAKPLNAEQREALLAMDPEKLTCAEGVRLAVHHYLRTETPDGDRYVNLAARMENFTGVKAVAAAARNGERINWELPGVKAEDLSKALRAVGTYGLRGFYLPTQVNSVERNTEFFRRLQQDLGGLVVSKVEGFGEGQRGWAAGYIHNRADHEKLDIKLASLLGDEHHLLRLELTGSGKIYGPIDAQRPLWVNPDKIKTCQQSLAQGVPAAVALTYPGQNGSLELRAYLVEVDANKRYVEDTAATNGGKGVERKVEFRPGDPGVQVGYAAVFSRIAQVLGMSELDRDLSRMATVDDAQALLAKAPTLREKGFQVGNPYSASR